MNFSNKSWRIRYVEILLYEIIKVTGSNVSAVFNEICLISRIYHRKYKHKYQHSNALSLCFICPCCWNLWPDLYTLLCGHMLCENCYGQIKKCVLCDEEIVISELKSNVLLSSLAKYMFSFFSDYFDAYDQVNELVAKSDYTRAIISFTNLFKYEFCMHQLLMDRSKIYVNLNQYDSALSDLFDLINIARNWKRAHYQRGIVLQLSGDMQSATEAFLNLFLLDPEDQEASSTFFSALKKLLTPSYLSYLETQERKYQGNIPYSLDNREKMADFIYISLKKQFLYDKKVLQLSNKQQLQLKSAHSADFIFKSGFRKLSFNDSTIQPKQHKTSSLFIEYIKTKEEFDCPLCLRVYLNPVSVTCGHTFCRHCIQRAIDYAPHCPLCKYDLTYYLKLKEIPVSVNLERFMNKFLWLEVAKYRFDYTNMLNSLLPSNGRCGFMICTVALPGIPCNLFMFEPKYRLLLRRAMETKSQIGMVLSDSSSSKGHCQIGSLLDVKSVEQLDSGCFNVITVAEDRRVRLKNSTEIDGYITAEIESFYDVMLDQEKLAILASRLVALYRKAQDWLAGLPEPLRLSIYSHYGELPLCDTLFTLSAPNCHRSNNSSDSARRPRPSCFSSPKLSRKRRYSLYTTSNSDITIRSNSVTTYNSYLFNNHRNQTRYNPLHFIQPFDWIWWLVAILPLDDQTKYNLLSTNNSLYRLDWLHNILNIVGDNVGEYYSGEGNVSVTQIGDSDSLLPDINSPIAVIDETNTITPTISTTSLPTLPSAPLISDTDTENDV